MPGTLRKRKRLFLGFEPKRRENCWEDGSGAFVVLWLFLWPFRRKHFRKQPSVPLLRLSLIFYWTETADFTYERLGSNNRPNFTSFPKKR